MSRFINNDEYLGEVFLYTSLSDRILRVRLQKRNKVQHECMYCKGVIESGRSSVYVTGLDAGRFYSYHIHFECYE